MSQRFVLSSTYLGPVDYYSVLFHSPTMVEQYEYYTKQSYCNRCHIATPEGPLALSIPVVKSSGKSAVRDVRISKHSPWQRSHWRAIESAYNTTPFFEYYADDLRPLYERGWEFLLDFNIAAQQKVLELLNIACDTTLTTSYESYASHYDLRGAFHPKSQVSIATSVPYYQVFGTKTGFLPNLSIIDLLFNMGNESRIILRNTQIHN